MNPRRRTPVSTDHNTFKSQLKYLWTFPIRSDFIFRRLKTNATKILRILLFKFEPSMFGVTRYTFVTTEVGI
jgi:hypothetical protein